jgi:hypothetical protein
MKKALLIIALLITLDALAFKQIVVNSISIKPSYTEVGVTFNYLLPAYLKNSNGTPRFNDTLIANSYVYSGTVKFTCGAFTVDSVEGTTLCLSVTGIISPIATTYATIGGELVNDYNIIQTAINSITLKGSDTLIGRYWDGSWH